MANFFTFKNCGENLTIVRRKPWLPMTDGLRAGRLVFAALFLGGGWGVRGGINDVLFRGERGVAFGNFLAALRNHQAGTASGTRLILGELQRPTRTMIGAFWAFAVEHTLSYLFTTFGVKLIVWEREWTFVLSNCLDCAHAPFSCQFRVILELKVVPLPIYGGHALIMELNRLLLTIIRFGGLYLPIESR
jgi:hypothetical protein